MHPGVGQVHGLALARAVDAREDEDDGKGSAHELTLDVEQLRRNAHCGPCSPLVSNDRALRFRTSILADRNHSISRMAARNSAMDDACGRTTSGAAGC